MAEDSPHREIRAILLGSPSHYDTLRDMESGLTVEHSAIVRDVKPERIV
jgi:hypothetical protein